MKAVCTLAIALGFLLLLTPLFALSGDIYVAQHAAGADSGTNCNNAHSAAWFNSTANWGNDASQIGPGDTVHLCGTFNGTPGSTMLTIQSNGSYDRPITLLFEPGAKLTSPAFSWNGAIACTAKSHIVIDGGSTGTIENTANGSPSLGYAYHQGSVGVHATNCTYLTVKNLTIRNIFVNNGNKYGTTDTSGSGTTNIRFDGTCTGNTVTGNTLSNARSGVAVTFDHADASNVAIYNNFLNDHAWQIQYASGTPVATATNVKIYGNTMTDWSRWFFPTSAYHTDGVIAYMCPEGGCIPVGRNQLSLQIYNNYIYGDLGVTGDSQGHNSSSTGFINCAQNTTCTIFNNLLVPMGHGMYGTIWLGYSSGPHYIYHNTITSKVGGMGITTLGSYRGTRSLGPMTVKNNIFVGLTTGINDYDPILTDDVATCNNNVWSGPPVFKANAIGSGVTYSYATWKHWGYDVESSTDDPNLSRTYRPQPGSSAIGRGANLTSLGIHELQSDKAGIPRSLTGSCKPGVVGCWDAGALQFPITRPAPVPPSGLQAVVN